MTEEQTKLLFAFEEQVRQLMQICKELRQENDELRSELYDLRKGYNWVNDENKTIKAKYENLKTVRMISYNSNFNYDDFKGAKNRLSKLVKEVDQCIALLSG